MSFKNKIDASFEEIIRLVAKVISGTGADSLFGFRTEATVKGTDASGYEQLTVSNTVKILTVAVYGSATHAVISVEDAEIRYTLDGTDPTTTLGHLVYVGDDIILTSAADIAAFKCIRATATDAEINATYSAAA